VALPLGRGSSPIQPLPTQEAGAPQGVTPSLSPLGLGPFFPARRRDVWNATLERR
jgi:hypothetical protein